MPENGATVYSKKGRCEMRSILLVLASLALLSSVACGQAKPHKIQGSGSTPQSIKFAIDREYCSDRNAYTYDDSGVTLGIKNAGTKTTDHIDNPAHFEDPGGPIIGPADSGGSPNQTSLMSDGSDASRLVARAFFAGACTAQQAIRGTTAQPAKLLSAQYYVINIVAWNRVTTSGKSWYQIQSNEWYVFNTSDKSVVRQTPFRSFRPTLTNENRIYGSKAVGFLAIHLKPKETPANVFARFQVSYNVSVKKKQPINVQDLIALLQVIGGGAVAGVTPEGKPELSPKMIGLYGGGLIGAVQNLPDDITFEANIVFPPSADAQARDILDPRDPYQRSFYHEARYNILGTSFSRSVFPVRAAQESSPQGAQGTNDQQTKAQVTCDPTLDPKTSVQSSCSFSKTYDDEGLYHWDVSVGVPVKSVKELQYSSTDGSVTAKEISRLNAYGFFDVYPVATDLKATPAFAWPHLIVGLPFSGKVFNKPFFGSGGVVNFQQIPKIGPAISKVVPVKFNFYGGVVYNKEFRPATLAIGSPASPGAVANNLVPHRVWKGQFGIEFSIRDVKDKLTSSKKDAAANSASTKTSTASKN